MFDGNILNRQWVVLCIHTWSSKSLGLWEVCVTTSQGGLSQACHRRSLGALEHYFESLESHYDKPYLIHRLISRSLSPVRQQWERLQDTPLSLESELSSSFSASILELKLDMNTLLKWQKFSHDASLQKVRQLAQQSLGILCHWLPRWTLWVWVWPANSSFHLLLCVT